MSIDLSTMGKSYKIEILERRPSLICAIDKRSAIVTGIQIQPKGLSSITIDGKPYEVWCAIDGNTIWVHIEGRVYSVEVNNSLEKLISSNQSSDEIRSDMPGTVVEIHTSEGAYVATGDALMTIESMKMQVIISAPRNGTIERIHYKINATFDKGTVLVSLAAVSDRNQEK